MGRHDDAGPRHAGGPSEGVAINDAGQVTGTLHDGRWTTHAFLWDGTTMLDLGTLGGSSSSARAINASGQVTGTARTRWSITPSCGTARRCWTSMPSLTQPIRCSRLSISFGVDINDRGQILANGFDIRTANSRVPPLTRQRARARHARAARSRPRRSRLYATTQSRVTTRSTQQRARPRAGLLFLCVLVAFAA